MRGLAILILIGSLLGFGCTLTNNAQQDTPLAPTTFAQATSAVGLVPVEVGSPPPANGNLRVHFIDVGQGDSILIQTPTGATALIDGGYDNGMALAYLQQQGISRIDVMLVSHPHADHIGGLVEVMNAMPVGQIWTNGAIHTTGIFEEFLDTIAARQIPYYEAERGITIEVGDLELAVLHVNPAAPELNDTSLVLHLTYGEVSFLFTGDAEWPAEQAMLNSMENSLPATILKVGHHASHTSSAPDFLVAVRPEIAVYSAGSDNTYGHPHQETITNLQAIGATIYGTAVNGTVIVTTDGLDYEVIPTRHETQGQGGGPTPTPNTSLGYDPNGPDRDCGAFETHAEAQAFFIAAGGPARDSYHLNGDNDGIACKSLP